jgi:hypothetical protein
VLSGASGTVSGTNQFATKEPGEPGHGGKSGGASVWYTWRAPATGIATFHTKGSSFDTLLGIYTGAAVNSLTTVADDEDAGGFYTSEVQFNAVTNIDYQIAIDGLGGAVGSFILGWNLEATAGVIPIIFVQPQSQTIPLGNSVTFSVTASDPAQAGLSYQWFFNGGWIPGANVSSYTLGQVVIDNVGYFVVGVTNGSGRGIVSKPAALELGPFSFIQSRDKLEDFSLSGGPGFAGPSARGGFQASAAMASGFPASVGIGTIFDHTLSNGNSGACSNETHCGAITGASRWFGFQATNNGTILLDTTGSRIETVLASYLATNLCPRVPIACDRHSAPDGRGSLVRFQASTGKNYWVAVDGVNGAQGIISLHFEFGRPPAVASAPTDQTVAIGQSAALNVIAAPNALPGTNYQWRWNGTDIPGATNAAFIISDAQPAHAGSYTVVLRNSIGAVTSQPPAVLVVDTNFVTLAESTFIADHEQWAALGALSAATPIHRNAGIGGFISITNTQTGSSWFWLAAQKFLGNKSAAYGGFLEFQSRQSSVVGQRDHEDDICLMSSSGLLLFFDTAANPTPEWTSYRVPLHERTGWRKNDLDGPAPTQLEMLSALASLTNIQIRGEFSPQIGTGDLDNVALLAPATNHSVLLVIAAPSTNQISLEWPVTAFGFELESTPALAPADWTVVPGEPALINGLKTILTDSRVGNSLFRLKKPAQ